MAGFPWSELGLDGPADERGISRAYAARLKIVRPDVDAAAFQRLVQARDAALRAIEQPAVRSPPPASPRIVEPKPEVPAPPERMPDAPEPPDARSKAPPFLVELGKPTDSPEKDEPNKPRLAKPTLVEIELPAETRPPPSTPPPPRPVIADIDPPKPAPLLLDRDPSPSLAKPETGATRPEPATPEAVAKLLSAFLDAWTHDLPLPGVAPILKLLMEQSIVARERLESEALRAATMLLDGGLMEQATPAARQQMARSLILGLDDDYAWTSSDRRLYAMLPQAKADQIARQLRALREWEKTGQIPSSAPPAQEKKRANIRWAWLPLLCLGVFKWITVLTQTPPLLPQTTAPVVYGVPGVPPPKPNPNDATALFTRGIAYDNLGEYDLAIQEYDQAIRLKPSDPRAYYNRGLDYANKSQFERAIQDYDQAVRLDPGNANGFVSRGVAYDGLGQYDRAIQDYDQAIRLNPSFALAFVDRGIAYANKEQYARAIQDYDQALRLNPNDMDALYNRGQAKRASGDIAGGDADIAKARPFGPGR